MSHFNARVPQSLPYSSRAKYILLHNCNPAVEKGWLWERTIPEIRVGISVQRISSRVRLVFFVALSAFWAVTDKTLEKKTVAVAEKNTDGFVFLITIQKERKMKSGTPKELYNY